MARSVGAPANWAAPALSKKILLSLTRYRNNCLPGLSDANKNCPERAFQQGAWRRLPDESWKGGGPAALETIWPFTTSASRSECAMVAYTLAPRATMPKGVLLFGAAGSTTGTLGPDRPAVPAGDKGNSLIV